MSLRVAVIGAAGYVGGELLRLLFGHPEVSSVVATSRSQAGKPLADVHPALRGRPAARFSGDEPAVVARAAEVVFLALEHGESSKIMAQVLETDVRLVVDLAADFRIKDPDLHRRYYEEHPSAELVRRFEYGLADVRGTALLGARAIAAPGCFATASQLALYLLRDAPLLAEPAIFGITGSSGAGVHPRATTHHPARAHNLFGYSVLGHRHEAEIAEQWRAWTGRPGSLPRLMAHSGPFVRGIYAAAHARLGQPVGANVVAAAKAWAATRPFVQMVPAPPELTHVIGSNDALIHTVTSADGLEVAVSVAIDNLVKGAGGQGVQAMNLALGFDEAAGLRSLTAFPI